MKHLLKRTIGATSTALVAGLTVASVAFAASSLYGDATFVQPGNGSPTAVELVSDSDPGFGGIDFDVTSGLTFAELETLSTDFMPEEDDVCIGGSVRFQINVETPSDGVRNIFAYFGSESGSEPCVPGEWQNSSDLLADGKTLDTAQIGGGPYQAYADAVAAYGDYPVVGIQIAVDGGWASADGEQTFLIDNAVINGENFAFGNEPANKDACKKGGWQELTRADDSSFKNQGDCIQYVNTGK